MHVYIMNCLYKSLHDVGDKQERLGVHGIYVTSSNMDNMGYSKKKLPYNIEGRFILEVY